MTLKRRTTLLGLTALATASRVKFAFADAPTNQRFIVILLRGALDGMSAVVPYGDSGLLALRPKLIPPAPGQPNGMYDLGGFYGLNPALPGIYAMYQAGEALPIHAVAGPYRTRSHFAAQDLLQLGAAGDETGITSGWLNRVIAELPPRQSATPAGLAAGIGTPLLLQGPVPVGSYATESFATPSPDLYARIAALNASDPLTGPAIATGLKEMSFDKGVMSADIMSDDIPTMPGDAPKKPGGGNSFPALATAVGHLLAAPNGPRIAAFQLEGWDTHGSQVHGLNAPLSGLDTGITNLKAALGPVWANTAVLVMTEFGRTAAMNGTNGTDHGTATVAFVLGGNIAGGKVRGNWPGLAAGQLFQNRDLAPTTDARSVAKGALVAHLGLSDTALARVFPSSGDAAPLQGITRAT
jgi:uncharacterized protein (DUF1501 family)